MPKLETTKMSILDVQPGQMIIEYQPHNKGKPTRIEVKDIVHSACYKRGTHVNGNMCYDHIAVVNVLTGYSKTLDEMNPDEKLDYIAETLGVDRKLLQLQ